MLRPAPPDQVGCASQELDGSRIHNAAACSRLREKESSGYAIPSGAGSAPFFSRTNTSTEMSGSKVT